MRTDLLSVSPKLYHRSKFIPLPTADSVVGRLLWGLRKGGHWYFLLPDHVSGDTGNLIMVLGIREGKFLQSKSVSVRRKLLRRKK